MNSYNGTAAQCTETRAEMTRLRFSTFAQQVCQTGNSPPTCASYGRGADIEARRRDLEAESFAFSGLSICRLVRLVHAYSEL